MDVEVDPSPNDHCTDADGGDDVVVVLVLDLVDTGVNVTFTVLVDSVTLPVDGDAVYPLDEMV